MTKVTLWLQTDDTHKQYLWDFCAISEIGAREWGIPFKKFYKSEEIPNSPYNVIIGSVEECSTWLNKNGYNIPNAIDMLQLASFSGRRFKVESKENRIQKHNSLYKISVFRYLKKLGRPLQIIGEPRVVN